MAKVCAGWQTTVGGRNTARRNSLVHEMAQGLLEEAAKTIIVGKEVIHHSTEFRDIAASSIQKSSSLLRWQIENDSEELLRGLLKIGHAFDPASDGFGAQIYNSSDGTL
jgi:iron uptake system EfeUOB component EfeO/EfeM